jgi:hypothetical protein
LRSARRLIEPLIRLLLTENRVGQRRENLRRRLASGQLAPQHHNRRSRRQTDDLVINDQRLGAVAAPAFRAARLNCRARLRQDGEWNVLERPSATMTKRFFPDSAATGASSVRLNFAASA